MPGPRGLEPPAPNAQTRSQCLAELLFKYCARSNIPPRTNRLNSITGGLSGPACVCSLRHLSPARAEAGGSCCGFGGHHEDRAGPWMSPLSSVSPPGHGLLVCTGYTGPFPRPGTPVAGSFLVCTVASHPHPHAPRSAPSQTWSPGPYPPRPRLPSSQVVGRVWGSFVLFS